MTFLHEYDFGTTTELNGQVVSEHESALSQREPVRLLARNDPPVFVCDVCGEPTTQVGTECMWYEDGWLCDAHAKAHKRSEELLLPVMNSPRMGVCGYEG
jgi:hypothetical protein